MIDHFENPNTVPGKIALKSFSLNEEKLTVLCESVKSRYIDFFFLHRYGVVTPVVVILFVIT